jgi:hypothetical protein
MAHPDPSPTPAEAGLLARLEAVEDSVQQTRFVDSVKIDAVQNGLGIVYSQLQRVQQEMTGFRAETTAHLAAQDTKLDEHGALLAEILRRLPPPASQQA